MHAMKLHERVEVQLYRFLTSTVVEGSWSVPLPDNFTPGEEPPVQTEWEAGWGTEPVLMNPRRDVFCPFRELNHDSSDVHPVA